MNPYVECEDTRVTSKDRLILAPMDSDLVWRRDSRCGAPSSSAAEQDEAASVAEWRLRKRPREGVDVTDEEELWLMGKPLESGGGFVSLALLRGS
jgi:hypothetical protein